MSKDITDKSQTSPGMSSLYISYDGILEPLGQSQIISYLKGLSKKGINFILLTYEKKRNLQNKKVSAMVLQELKSHNIKWFSLPYHKNPPFFSTLFDCVMGLMVCIYIAKVEKPILIHSRGYAPSLIGFSLKKIFRTKLIFDMRGFWPDQKIESKQWNKNNPLFPLTKYFERKLIKNADEIVVLTKRAKRIIGNYGYISSDNISVIPCCVDVNAFRLDTQMRAELRKKNNLTGKFVFAHTGSFETGYIKDEMLDYFKAAKEIIPNIHFLILSQYSQNEILKLIGKKQLKTDDFTFISSSFEQMPRYLSMVDAGTLFLSLGFSKRACSPTKFAEFLSCGIPVVSSRKIGDTEETIINNKVGAIINHFNDSEYKRTSLQLLELLDDNNLRARCRQVAEKEFSLDKGIDKYYSIYTRIRMGCGVLSYCPVCKKMDYKFFFKKENLRLIKCMHCGLIRFDNIPQVFDIKNYYYYKNKVTKKQQDLYNPITTKRYNNLLIKLQSFRKNNAVFDIGCGAGQFLSVAKKMNWQAKGVEISPYAVKVCKDFNLDVSCQDFLQAKIQHNYYDIVTMFEVLEHLTQPREYLLKANKILRKGGVIIITTPNFNCLTRILLRERWRLIHKEHLFYFTPASFKKLIHDTNFKVLELITKDITLPELDKLISSKKSDQTIDTVVSKQQSLRKVIEERKTLLFLKNLTNILLNMTKLGESIHCICQKV